MTVSRALRIVVLILVACGLVGVTAVAVLGARGTLAERARVYVVDLATETFGRTVTITAVSGDPLRGVTLEGVHVGGRAGTPGTFFDAPRLVARFHLPTLFRHVLTRQGLAGSLVSVEVDRPFLALSIDAQGRWNYADLLTQQPAAAGSGFAGTIHVREGSVVFTDASAALAAPFTAHFERITGLVDFANPRQVRIVGDAVNTDGETPGLVHVAGTTVLEDETYDLDLTTRGVSVAHWGPHLIPLPWLAWQGGTLDSTLHLLSSKWGTGTTLDYRGRLMVRHGRAVVLPQQTVLVDITGPLAVDNASISTTGVTMQVGASPVFARGEVGFASGLAVDLLIRSSSLDLGTLHRLVAPGARLHLSGVVRGEARVVGPVDALEVTGAIVDGEGSIAQQTFAHLSTVFQYAGGLLELESLATDTAGGHVRGTLRVDLDGRTFFALADARGVDARALKALGISPDETLRGSVSGFVAVAGKPGAIIAQGRIQVGSGSASGADFDAIESLFWYDRGRVEVDRFAGRRGPAQLHVSGELARTGQLALDMVATTMDLQSVGRRLGVGRWVSGRGDFTGSLTGTVTSPVLTGELEARQGTLGLLPYTTARGDIRVTTTGISTSLMTLRDGPGRYQAVGAVQWDASPRVDLTVQATGVPAQQLLDIAKLPLRIDGTVQGTLRFFGEGAKMQAEGSVALVDPSVEGQHLDRAEATFHVSPSGLRLDRALAAIGRSTVEAQGTIGRTGEVAISFSAHAFELQPLAILNTDFLRARGPVELTGTMSGTIASPTISAQVSSSALSLNGQVFDAASGSAYYRGGRLTLTPLDLQQGQGRFRLSGSVEFRTDPLINLQTSVQGADLTTLLGLARVVSPVPLRGRVDGTFNASGPLSNPTASLNFHLADGALGDHPVREANVRADLANHAVTLQTFSIKPERGELVGAGRINLRGASEVEFSGRNLPLDVVRPLLGAKRPLAGDLDFTMQASGTRADPEVGISATVAEGGIGDTTFDRLVMQMFYRDGLLHIEQGLLQQGRHKVKAEGTVPFNPARPWFDETKPMDLRVFLSEANLSVLGLLTDQVERAEGPLEGQVLLTGSVTQPRMVGSLKTTNGVIKLKNLDPAFTAVQGDLTFDADEIRVANLQARLGEGTVTVAGTVGIREFRPDRLDLRLSVVRAPLTYAPLFAGVVDSELRLGGSARSPRLSGVLTLSQGNLNILTTGRGNGTRTEPEGVNVGLDVDVNAGEGLWVNAGSLRLQAHGTVHASGTHQRPRLTGAVQTDRGTFTAFNSTFTLLEGQATFSEFRGMTPYVDARAQTHVGTTTVFAQIQGTPDDPDLLLSSDPPLPHRQIVALLAGQAGISQLRQDQEGAVRLELSQVLFGSVGTALGQALGFQEFVILYESTQPLQLRIGRLLINDLYLAFTEQFKTPAPYYFWSLEYHLSPAGIVSLSIDNQSQYSLMYRYTLRFH